jgi:Eukaryotic aspartyl protease
VDIGTPKQTVTLAVDIASYATWVIQECDAEYLDADKCAEYGTYNDTLSSTSVYVRSWNDSTLSLQDGDKHQLIHRMDDFSIASAGKAVYSLLIDYSNLTRKNRSIAEKCHFRCI